MTKYELSTAAKDPFGDKCQKSAFNYQTLNSPASSRHSLFAIKYHAYYPWALSNSLGLHPPYDWTDSIRPSQEEWQVTVELNRLVGNGKGMAARLREYGVGLL